MLWLERLDRRKQSANENVAEGATGDGVKGLQLHKPVRRPLSLFPRLALDLLEERSSTRCFDVKLSIF
jgi:hypothetical protein